MWSSQADNYPKKHATVCPRCPAVDAQQQPARLDWAILQYDVLHGITDHSLDSLFRLFGKGAATV